ncbi:MAG: hypothetical protein KDD02_06525 [Phaeodactylibacter sp.]|nr:hypothetical protein [Phaeodactylibacter sp.]MCB9299092.1 hypothetical protein [Lewinellaceae bacterium]HQU58491.1 hypothetical protein [Saprospiraceae bacterium]
MKQTASKQIIGWDFMLSSSAFAHIKLLFIVVRPISMNQAMAFDLIV